VDDNVVELILTKIYQWDEDYNYISIYMMFEYLKNDMYLKVIIYGYVASFFSMGDYAITYETC
jgi:hypothetical protein